MLCKNVEPIRKRILLRVSQHSPHTVDDRAGRFFLYSDSNADFSSGAALAEVEIRDPHPRHGRKALRQTARFRKLHATAR
jgi:hypothetical protein